MTRNGFRQVITVCAVLVALAACGSTATGRPEAGSPDFAGEIDTRPGGAPADRGVQASSPSDSSNATGDRRGAPGGSAGGVRTAVGTGSSETNETFGTPGTAVSKSPISVGLEYIDNAGTANASVGVEGVTPADKKALWSYQIDRINKAGGVAGRRLVPVWHMFDENSTNTPETDEQAACDNFTRDHHVLVVLTDETHGDTYNRCLEQRGVTQIRSGLTMADAVEYERTPHLVEVGSVSVTRQAALLADGLFAAGYYTRGAKVGLLTVSNAQYDRAVNRELIPRLQRRGVTLANIQRVSQASDSSQQLSSISNAVLRFKADGVTHVLIFDVRGGITLFFVEGASSQQYYPRYGWISTNAGHVIKESVPDKKAFEASIILGWLPQIDADAASTGVHPPAGPACLQSMRAYGYQAESSAEEFHIQAICEIANAFKMAGDLAGARLSADSLVTALTSLRPFSVPASATYGIDLTRGHHDGATRYRALGWVTGCGCFRYTSGLKDLP